MKKLGVAFSDAAIADILEQSDWYETQADRNLAPVDRCQLVQPQHRLDLQVAGTKFWLGGVHQEIRSDGLYGNYGRDVSNQNFWDGPDRPRQQQHGRNFIPGVSPNGNWAK